MTELAGYILTETLRDDGELILWRGLGGDGTRSRLIVTSAQTPPAPATLSRLEHEYALRGELDAAWAAQPTELSRQGGRTMLLLDDPGGVPLSACLGTPIPLEVALRIAVGIATALGKLHHQGLIHKDLQPDNVLVDPASGQAWLTGFGLASRLPRERQIPAPLEVFAGSLAYMAPEQTGRMNRSVDSRSDLYAFGVMLYQMLAGVLPFSATDPMEWVHCHVAREPVPLVERGVAVPAPVAAVVAKLLAKTAEERYQTAEGVAADLRRCLDAWLAEGKIAPFALGGHDASGRLRLPEKLYGRAQESRQLLDAFDRMVESGRLELVLVSGYSGIGKSSLVNELQKVIVAPRGIFLSGKFDQYKRDIPYDTLAQAFQSLVRQILVQSESEVERWRTLIREAVGSGGQLLVDLIPELELVIGPQPAVPALPPTEAQNRFQALFQNFLGAVARAEHPLVLFLDDLQWLDAASLKLLDYLATHPDVRHLLLIGAYRDNEVDPSHPLLLTLDGIRKAGTPVSDIVLAPLSRADTRQLVADALGCAPAHAAPLADLVFDKTAGNPFFAIQFLSALPDEELLVFDPAGHWQWDLERIHAKGFTDNVVDLMLGKLARLFERTQQVLQQLACLGNSADLATLALVHGRSPEDTQRDLWEAVRAGYLLHLGEQVKFLHDRIQEAAYSQIPAAARPAMHLRIGRLLVAQRTATDIGDAIFDVVNQFNRGLALVTDDSERDAICRYNAQAGRKAKGAIAYASARSYLQQATQLLPADAWDTRYAETFELHLDLSECEFLAGRFAQADTLFNLMLAHCRSDPDRARVYSQRVRLYLVAGGSGEALTVVQEALALFGVQFPDTDEAVQAAFDAEYRDIAHNLRGRAIADLVDAPLATDPDARAMIGLLSDAMPPAFSVRPRLSPLVILKAVNASLRLGNTEASCFAYNRYGRLLVGLFGDIEAGFAFGELSLRLNEKLHDARLKGPLRYLHAAYIQFWRQPIATTLPMLEQAFVECLEVGDLLYAAYCARHLVGQLIEKGEPLDEVMRVARKYTAFFRQSRNEREQYAIRLSEQFVASLQGLTHDPGGFDDDQFSEAACFAALTQASYNPGIAYYQILKQIAAFLFERPLEALECAERAKPVLPSVMGLAFEATHHFIHALTLTALYPQVSAAQQQAYRQTLAEIETRLVLWAEHCPANYANRYALFQAEQARLAGDEFEAMRRYDEAVRLAREQGFVQNEALANELAARFYRGRGFAKIADTYLWEARVCYTRWGAHGKVAQLDMQAPHLKHHAARVAAANAQPGIEQLDALAVVHAAQALSGRIVLEELLDALMRIVLEHAGAQTCMLLLDGDAGPALAAEANVVQQHLEVRVHAGSNGGEVAPPLAERLPVSLLNYVRRSRERVILDDAAAPSRFAADPYLVRALPKSVLCLPIVRQGELAGVLYLENNLATYAFTADRIAVLELLASQAAVSLENARLYADVALENAERKRAEVALRNVMTEQQSILASSGVGIAFLREGRIARCNQAFADMFGYPLAELQDLSTRRLHLSDAAYAAVEAEALTAVARGRAYVADTQHPRRDGATFWVATTLTAVDRDDPAKGTIWVAQDIDQRKRAEEALRLRERAIASSVNAILITDCTQPHNPIIYVNPAFERITGYRADEAIGRNAGFLLGLDVEQMGLEEIGAAVRERRDGTALLRNYRKDGVLFWNDLAVSPVRDEADNVTHFVWIVNDVTERKRYEEQLEHQANYDPLTGLANRNLLADRLSQATSYANRSRRQVAVMLLDLDRFKVFNDSLGHSFGDEVLRTIARRLRECVRESDTVARLGGDEFVIVLTEVDNLGDCAAVARKVLAAIAEPLLIHGHEVCTTTSIGVSLYPRDGRHQEVLLKNADIAMYRVKDQGGDSFQFYVEAMNERVQTRFGMESELRRAIARDELMLYYQPKLDLRDGRIVGAEALLRWRHPELGMIPPSEFIPLAEESGLIVALGEWVILAACAQLAAWQADAVETVPVALNLSAPQLTRGQVTDVLREALAAHRLEASSVQLELTETALMQNPEQAAHSLQALREMGVKLSLDDFGTGYSSLVYLKRFRFDVVKIDRTFVADLTTNPEDAAIANAMIAMAHSLQLRVVAEGVETEGQLAYLRAQGCDEMQGYYFSPAVPADEFAAMLRAGRRLAVG